MTSANPPVCTFCKSTNFQGTKCVGCGRVYEGHCDACGQSNAVYTGLSGPEEHHLSPTPLPPFAARAYHFCRFCGAEYETLEYSDNF